MGMHCGYSGDSFIAKVTRFIIPDRPFWVDISCDCELHDIGSSVEFNKKADLKLKDDILDSFYNHVERKGWPEYQKTLFFFLLGYPTAYAYYIGVRIGGLPIKLKRELND